MNSIQLIFTQPWSLLYLLPYSNHFKLTNRQQKKNELLLIQSLVQLSIIALESFLEGNIVDFDAQVGENLCQIRAYKNIHLANFWLNSPENKRSFALALHILNERKKHLNIIVDEWERLTDEIKQYNKSLDAHETIEDFVKRHDIYIEFSEDMIYLISCYFLTHFAICDNDIPVGINFKKISSELSVSKHRSERLTHRQQLIVAKLGCDFIVKIASEVPLSKLYLKLLPKLYQLSDVDRYVLPCHIVTEIILDHCEKNSIPILFLLHRVQLKHHETICFLLNGSHYSHLSESNNDYCFVISGINYTTQPTSKNYLTYLNNLNLKELVLANTATHPQYAGSRLSDHSNNPFVSMFDSDHAEANLFSQRLQKLKKMAFKVGCYKEEPHEFFLKHIYASKIYVEINKLEYKKASIVSGLSVLTGEKATESV